MYMRTIIRHFDTKLVDLITGLPISWQPFFIFITNLGHPAVPVGIGLAVLIVGAVQSNVRLALSGVTIWAALAMGSILKLLINRPRPITEYAASIWLDKLSFPSGHATGSTVAYGLLAYFAWQLLPQPWNYIVVALLGLLILLIGVSRVYLGAHFPSDVIAGWLLGGAALLIIIFVITPFAAK